MCSIFLVEEVGGQYEDRYTHPIKAFACRVKAEEFRKRLESDLLNEISLTKRISGWLNEFMVTNPEPGLCFVDFDDPSYDFKREVAVAAHDREYRDWFDLWYGTLAKKLAKMGKKPYVGSDRNNQDPRRDTRNMGHSRKEELDARYFLTPIEFEN